MENELRNFIIGQYGVNAWQDIIRIQADLRKKQKEEQIRLAQERDQLVYNIFMFGIIALFVALTLPILWLIIQNV